MNLELSDWLHAEAGKLAIQQNISLEQLITLALTEKVSAVLTQEYFAQRAARGSRERFIRALERVPDMPADAKDHR